MPADAYFAFLGARLTDGVNLIDSLVKLSAHIKRQRPKKYWIPAAALVVLLTAAPVIYLYIQISEIDTYIDELNRYIHNDFLQAKSAEIEAVIADTALHSRIVDQERAKVEYEGGLARACGRTLNLITTTHSNRVTVTSFEFHESTGTVRVSATSLTESDASLYTGALKESPLVSSIRYTGYSYGSGGEYNFSVEVILERQVAPQ
jgi:hypothetical protein